MESKKSFRLPTFFSLLMLVVLTQIFLLKPIIGQGFTHEDYAGLFPTSMLKNQYFSDPINTWIKTGTHNASHEFYIVYLNKLFGENYDMYLYTSIFFKIVATLLLYPLILLITKNKLLSFLSTILYAISYSSAGALSLYGVGNEYIGVAFMSLLLIVYYFNIQKNKFWLLILSSFLITITYLTSPIRIFPIFAIIPTIELFLLFKNRFSKLLPSVFRLTSIFLPLAIIIFITYKNQPSDPYSLTTILTFFKSIATGNWFLILNPFWGMSYLFLPASYFKFFGNIDTQSFFTYLISPFCIGIILIAFLISFLLSNKPFRFFSILISINLVLHAIVFLLATHHLFLPANLISEYNPIVFLFGLYAGIFATFILSVSIVCLIEWLLIGRKNILLLLIFISPFFSLLFIISQWLFTQQQFMYQGGTHRYLVIPAIGMSLFLASLMTIIYQRKKTFIRSFLLLTVLIIFIFFTSKEEIAGTFYTKRNAGADLPTQELMKAQVLRNIPIARVRDNLLFYIKLSVGPEASMPWEEAFDWRNIVYWMHIKRSYLTDGTLSGCIAMTWDNKELQKMAVVQDGTKGFLYKDGGNKEIICLNNNKRFFKLDNLYAFIVDKGIVRNITEEVVSKLSFTPIQ